MMLSSILLAVSQVVLPAETPSAAAFEWREPAAGKSVRTCALFLSDRDALRPLERALAARGVTCAVLKREAEKGGDAWTAARRAVGCVRAAAPAHGFDPARLGVVGYAEDALPALRLAAAASAPEARVSFAISVCPTATGKESPAFDGKAAPVCLFGVADASGATNATTALYRELRRHGVSSEVHVFPDRDHLSRHPESFDRALEFLTQLGMLEGLKPEEKLLDRYAADDDRDACIREDLWPAGRMPDAQKHLWTPFLEWHLPRHRKSRAIQIVYSGGGYSGNSTDDFEVAPARRYLNGLGIAVVTLRYRMPRPVGLPKHVPAWKDLQRTIRLVRGKAAGYGLDSDRIGIMGSSAGGHLTLLGALSSTRKIYDRVDAFDDLPCHVRWAVAVYPAYSLTDGAEGPNVTRGNDNSAVPVPEFAFDGKSCPVLFIHGDADEWSAMNSVKCCERLWKMGLPGELHTLAGRPHAFQRAAAPGTGSWTYLDRIRDFLADRVREPAAAGSAPEPKAVMNLVNFVRNADFRYPDADLRVTIRNEIALNTKYGFRNTILLQYDALCNPAMMDVVLGADRSRTEYGVWIELVRPLAEKTGIAWRSDHDWDWHINPGFLMAYTQAERRALCDEIFRRFHETFGYYPKSVGSWLLDAYSMDYLQRKYDVKAFCICREQDETDAYGLRGGYFNGAYYPSKVNMLSAAVDMKNAVRAPVFRMLTPDPIYNYRDSLTYPGGNVATMEPAWVGGYDRNSVDAFFRIYAEPTAALNLSYMQTGQENNFGWANVSKGLPYQYERLAAYEKAGKIRVETLGETGARFIREHAANCPQTQVASEDWTGQGNRSVWYNCAHYRANVILTGGKLAIRDLHKMCDDYEEPFLRRVCTGWQAKYLTPPVCDSFLLKQKDASGMLELPGAFAGIAAETPDARTLLVTARRADGTSVRIRFDERTVTVEGASLTFAGNGAFRRELVFRPDGVRMTYDGYVYFVGVSGKVKPTDSGYVLTPQDGRLVLDLAR